MDTPRLLTQSPIIMGLSSSALILLFILSFSTPLPSLCAIPSHYSLPAIKSVFVEYVCSMWSLFSRSKEPILITPRNLFLLVNLIILFLFISLHLQKHAPASGKRSSKKRRQQEREKLIMMDKQAALLQGSSLEGSEAAAVEKEALISSTRAAEVLPESLYTEESFVAEAAPMQETAKLDHEGSLAEALPAVDSDCINGSDGEQIVLDEDGQLRLIGGPVLPTVDLSDTKGSDAEKSENERQILIESGNGSDAVKIVLEEDGQLRLIEATNGSDAETIVVEEDGQLRLIDRPQLPYSSGVTSRPLKSLSTGDDNYLNTENHDPNDINHKINDDNHSLIKFDCDIHSPNNNDSNSLNHNHTNLSDELNEGTYTIDCSLNHTNLNELNNGTDTIDCSLNHTNLSELNNGTEFNNAADTSLNHNLSHVDKKKMRASSSRPMKVKKSESLDATWKAINNNKGSANREPKNLIRQSSRQDFKLSRGGNAVMRASHNNKLVRREPSISQDELNAKVESFIAKFNEQIRIQRQQSLLSYMEMVDRGA